MPNNNSYLSKDELIQFHPEGPYLNPNELSERGFKVTMNDYMVDYWNRFANEWQSVHVQAHNSIEAKAMVWFKYMKPNYPDGIVPPISEAESEDIRVNDYFLHILKPTDFEEHELDSTIEILKKWNNTDD